jgi:hypothetical protein
MYKIQNWKLSVALPFSITCLTLAFLGDYSFAQNPCIPNVTCPARKVNDQMHNGNPAGRPGDLVGGKDPFAEEVLELIQQLQQKDPQAIQKLQQGLTPGSVQQTRENCSHPKTKP